MKRTAISLFTGAGGMDLGLEAAGFDTCVAVEMDDQCVETLNLNRPQWPVIHRSIHEVSSSELLSTAGLRVGDADLLVGGPPCQPFSKSGYWATGDAKRLDDERATTLDAYLRVLRDTQPRAFLLENVAGLVYRGKDEGFRLLERSIATMNRELGTHYQCEVLKLNAADFGVPQARERVFVVGSREGSLFGDLRATHSRPLEGDVQWPLPLPGSVPLPPGRTAWDALGDLDEPDDPGLRIGGKWAELLPTIPEGCNYLHHTERGEGLPLFGWRRRFWAFLLKLSKTLPSWTVTAQPGSATGPFHWNNRRLSGRELCRIQTIPDSFVVSGSLSAVQRQVGNAVPSALAELLGREVRARFYREPEYAARAELTLLPPSRGAPPPPVPTKPVPSKYLRLVGTHTEHPGTGKGYGALRRSVSNSTTASEV